MSFFSLITGNFRNTDPNRGVFVETAPHEKGFAAHYQKNIKPHIYSFERLRLEALEQASRRIRISIPLFVLLLISIFYMLENSIFHLPKGEEGYLFVIVALLAFGYACIWVNSPIEKYGNSIKVNIFPNIISFIGDFKYSLTCPNRVRMLEDSDIIPSHDRETSEDAFCGAYKEVSIDLFETNLEVKRSSGDSSHYESIFKGIVISLGMNKNFKGKTIVKRDSGKIGNWVDRKFKYTENVKLEDPKFEKIFEVYSTDQVEARYLLTTAFMERLLQLSESFGGKGIECSFYNNKLLMTIPITRNLFEPGSIYDSEDFVEDAKSLLHELNLIFQIIDILKLNQNIGM